MATEIIGVITSSFISLLTSFLSGIGTALVDLYSTLIYFSTEKK